MTRNWYAVYTRPLREKKVSALLTKKGIKNYFPVNNIVDASSNNRKSLKEPLIGSYVFVYITENEITNVKAIPGIVNFLYWMTKPAIIRREEIEAVRQLTAVYHNIKLEKTAVNINDTVRIIDEPVISFKENSASVMFHTLKIVLPSLGYTLIAARDKVNDEKIQRELSEAVFVPKKSNSFFSN